MEKNRKGLCIGSMIIGIISILMFVVQPFVLIASIVGVVIGIMGLKSNDGVGMAIAGIVMSIMGAFAGILVKTAVIGTVAIIDKTGDDGHHYHFEQNDDGSSQTFDFYIGGDPKEDLEETPEERPDSDDYLL